MASNFKISVHRNSDSLDLKLMGDFDGTSACELLNVMMEKCGWNQNREKVRHLVFQYQRMNSQCCIAWL